MHLSHETPGQTHGTAVSTAHPGDLRAACDHGKVSCQALLAQQRWREGRKESRRRGGGESKGVETYEGPRASGATGPQTKEHQEPERV